MNATQAAELTRRIRYELALATRIDPQDIDVVFDSGAVVLCGTVDDAAARAMVEVLAREVVAMACDVRSVLTVRDEFGEEASAKMTEFGTRQAARWMLGEAPATDWL